MMRKVVAFFLASAVGFQVASAGVDDDPEDEVFADSTRTTFLLDLGAWATVYLRNDDDDRPYHAG